MCFEEQIKANYNFTVLSKAESDKFSVNKHIVFKSFADEYIYKIKKNRVKPSTFNSYRINYENYILPVYGKTSKKIKLLVRKMVRIFPQIFP